MRHALLALLLAACGEPTPAPTVPTPPPEAPAAAPEPSGGAAAAPEPSGGAADEASEEEVQALAAGLRGLGAGLLREVGVPPEQNAAIAPLSLAGALGMTAAGGRGPTAGEVWTGLGLAGREDRAAAIVAATLRGLAGEELAVAQRLFVASDLSLEPSFVALTGERYGAPVERLDFTGADAAIARINGWTSEATRTRIPVIVPPGGVNGSTRLVLVNALYFLANWQTSFDPARTTDDSFVAPAGAVPCRMMRRRGPALLGAAAGASVLRLPYAGERFVATFVLPAEGTTLASLEATMTGETIGAWLAAPAPVREVELELPRFRVEAAAPMELRAPLTRLGMGTMFDDADFSGIAAEPLRVSSVFHRVFVETTEEGTEAAAATAVAVARGAALSTPRFRADRPFLFFVTDARGVVLFLARVAVPG